MKSQKLELSKSLIQPTDKNWFQTLFSTSSESIDNYDNVIRKELLTTKTTTRKNRMSPQIKENGELELDLTTVFNIQSYTSELFR